VFCKDKENFLISNFIFHFVFAVFTVWAGVAWFILQNRSAALRNALVPLLSLEKIEFPKHRSLFVRGIKSLEEELSILLQSKVTIKCPIFDNTYYLPSILRTFCVIFNSNHPDEVKNIKFKNDYFTLSEFNNKIIKKSKSKKISFIIQRENNNNCLWQVEIHNA
jgi:hypothetical protein